MEEHATEIIPYLLSLIGLLATVFGKMVLERLDRLTKAVEKQGDTMIAIERDLRGGLSSLDRRVARLEARCESNHDRD